MWFHSSEQVHFFLSWHQLEIIMHCVWPRGCESERWVNDPCAIVIHHTAVGLHASVCVGVCSGAEQGGGRDKEIIIPHPSCHIVIWMESISRHRHGNTWHRKAAAEDLSAERALINVPFHPQMPAEKSFWHLSIYDNARRKIPGGKMTFQSDVNR